MVGYSDKSLQQKLGVKSGQMAYYHNAPKEYFKILGKLPEDFFVIKQLNQPVDFWHGFYTESDELKADIDLFKFYLQVNGTLWISWPKKASKVKTDLTEQTLRDLLLPHNLVDIKVCAITDIWSGLKFVWRKS
jgi:hypothetical protein